MNYKKLIFALVLAITTFLVGIVAVTMFTNYQLPWSLDDFKSGNLTDDAPVDSENIRTLVGTVTSINGTSISLHITSNDSFEGSALADRIITANASTTIVKFAQKNLEAFRDEMAKFGRTTKPNASSSLENTPSVIPPSFFNLANADFASIKVGDMLVVTAFENIKLIKEFTASEIKFQSLPHQPK